MNNNEKLRNTSIPGTFDKLLQNEKVQKGITFIQENHAQTVKEQIEITEIPAPPFHETERSKNYLERLKDLGLTDVQMDDVGNVFGVRKGTGNGPKIFVSAHLDTVFPPGTDTTVKEEDGILYAPGISDDTRGLAEVLAIIRAFNDADIQHEGDIIFGGTVGEEGAGDLRGVKHFFTHQKDIDGFISIDGPDSNKIVYLGTGSYRYKVTYKGPGGHSFGAFGLPSATHALGRAIAKIADLQTPSEPKTTFTVGEVAGGTSVNAIAEEASMLVDLRSNKQEQLDDLNEKFLKLLDEAAAEENKRWGSSDLIVEIEKFGNRPPASQSAESPIVQAAVGAINAMGGEAVLNSPSSTDSNHPISIGIPSVTLGRGGKAGLAHTVKEWFDPKDAHIAIQRSFLTIIGLSGLTDVSESLLSKQANK